MELGKGLHNCFTHLIKEMITWYLKVKIRWSSKPFSIHQSLISQCLKLHNGQTFSFEKHV